MVDSVVVLDSTSRSNPPLPITIDGLFSQARAILADTGYSLRVVFDTSSSYPTVIAAVIGVPDADWTDSVSDFVPLR